MRSLGECEVKIELNHFFDGVIGTTEDKIVLDFDRIA